MALTFSELESEAMRLTSSDRAALADKLMLSLDDSETGPIDEAWLREATRRLEEIRSGKVTTIPGDQVFSELHARFPE